MLPQEKKYWQKAERPKLREQHQQKREWPILAEHRQPKHYLIPYYKDGNTAYAYLFIKALLDPYKDDEQSAWSGGCPNAFGGNQDVGNNISTTLETELSQESHGKINCSNFAEWPKDDKAWEMEAFFLYQENNRNFYKLPLKSAIDESVMNSNVSEAEYVKLHTEKYQEKCENLEDKDWEDLAKSFKESTGKIIKIDLGKLGEMSFKDFRNKRNNIKEAIEAIRRGQQTMPLSNTKQKFQDTVRSLFNVLSGCNEKQTIDQQADWIASATVKALYKLKKNLGLLDKRPNEEVVEEASSSNSRVKRPRDESDEKVAERSLKRQKDEPAEGI